MNRLIKILFLTVLFVLSAQLANAKEHGHARAEHNGETFIVRNFILEHVSDTYIWHVTKIGDTQISVPLPVIVYSKQSGWNVFMASRLAEGQEYNGFYISEDDPHKGKVVQMVNGQEVRPFDLSITRNVFTLLLSGSLLIFLIMYVVRAYRKEGYFAKNKLVLFMEMFVMMINDDVIKPAIGKEHKKYAPYLLTLFFFILINNVMGLIPVFPFGANLTGNITFTFTLSVITFIIVNVSGTKEYWKEIFWPEVPLAMKFPVPFFPILEFIGIFTKPFALMLRLLANIIAGHSIMLGLISIIFITVSMGTAVNISLSAISILLSLFISFVEILVAFIQAYIFTLLSAVYIGLARVKTHHK